MTLSRHVLRRLAADLNQLPEVPAAGEPATTEKSGLSIGRYELVACIGKGSGGVVWSAWDPLLERPAALKVLRHPQDQLVSQESPAAAEFAALANLHGPGFVQVFDVGRAEVPPAVFGERGGKTRPHAFCAMELVTGGSLADRIAEGPMEPREAAELICQVARALSFAHKRGILHLDIKPSNILLAPTGPKLVDFGAMRDLFEAGVSTGRPVGTIGFLAPEQALGRESDIGPRSDVHGLGATLAALVCGINLPGDDDLAAVDPELAAIFERAMARDPERRYASAVGLAAALEAYLAPEASTPPSHQVESTQKARRRALITLGIFAGLAASVFLIGKTLSGASQNPKSTAKAQFDEVLADFARRSEPMTTWSLADNLEQLRARAGALLSNFSFHPADLDLFAALSERGALAQAITSLVRKHQDELAGQALPAELAAFRRLDAYIDGEAPSTSDLGASFPSDRFAQLETAMEALIEEEPERARAALQHLQAADPDRRLLVAAANFEALDSAEPSAADPSVPANPSRDDVKAELEDLVDSHAFLESDLGLLALLREDPRQALVRFDAALARYPDLAAARHHRIVALWRLGREQEAKAALASWINGADAASHQAIPGEFTLASRSSSVYIRPSRARLATDPWLADVRAASD